MCEYIKTLKIDICVFQEVCATRKCNQIEIFKKYLGYDYSLYSINNSLFDYKKGNLILSKYPILDKKEYKFTKYYLRPNNTGISIKINYDNKDIWITNVHLSCDITGYQQNQQINELLSKIDLNERNIICGDFNSLLNYKGLKKIRNNFINGIIDKTYPSIYPLYQLDYVLYNNMENLKIERLNSILSDHRPILINI